jgi:hypothetical protein
MEKTIFHLSVQSADWDGRINGWRCPALKIPGAVVDALFVQGRKIDSNKYEVDTHTGFLRWSEETKPKEVTLAIRLDKSLTSAEETDKWKKLAVLLPFVAAIVSASMTYVSRPATSAVAAASANNCTDSNPTIICSGTFKELYKKWPNILAPLERFLQQPTLLYSKREAVLTLQEIKGNKVIFEVDEVSQLENPYGDPITESITTFGDISQKVVSFEITDELNNKVPIRIESSTSNDGNKQEKHTAEVRVPSGQSYTVSKKFRLEKELVGEYNIITNKPIMKYYSMEFKIAPHLSHKVKITPWKNSFTLIADQPIEGLENEPASRKVRMEGPIYSGQGFIPEWSVSP